MELITGVGLRPHFTSAQFRDIMRATIGSGSYVLDINEHMEPELQTNNSLKIRSGTLAHHGSISEVKRNTYDEVTITSGTQGMKRIDLVVMRYQRNAETELEECNWKVIMGTPAASNPKVPDYIQGNMQNGDLIDDCPMFEVHLDGINVTEVKKICTTNMSLSTLNSNLTSMIHIKKITSTDSGNFTLSDNSDWTYTAVFNEPLSSTKYIVIPFITRWCTINNIDQFTPQSCRITVNWTGQYTTAARVQLYVIEYS